MSILNLVTKTLNFKKEIFNSLQDLFVALRAGQDPDDLLVTCSDSRIDPNLVTCSTAGDNFLIRNAGNLVPKHTSAYPTTEAGTIEYAMLIIGIPKIIVCGHSNCGAMAGLLHPETLKEASNVAAMLNMHASEVIALLESGKYADLPESEKHHRISQANVLVQMQHLKTHPSVLKRLKQGALEISGWYYHFETGEIDIYDPEVDAFLSTELWLEKNLKPFFIEAVDQIFQPKTLTQFYQALKWMPILKQSDPQTAWQEIKDPVIHSIQTHFGAYSSKALDDTLLTWFTERNPNFEKSLYGSEGYRLFCSAQLKRDSFFFPSSTMRSQHPQIPSEPTCTPSDGLEKPTILSYTSFDG